jgi:hypothetical protein
LHTPSRSTPPASHKISTVGTLFLAFVLAAEKTTAEEGRDIILVMLATGFVFLGVILLGQLGRWYSHKRTARKRLQRRVY